MAKRFRAAVTEESEGVAAGPREELRRRWSPLTAGMRLKKKRARADVDDEAGAAESGEAVRQEWEVSKPPKRLKGGGRKNAEEKGEAASLSARMMTQNSCRTA
jgi:hypothetical protein